MGSPKVFLVGSVSSREQLKDILGPTFRVVGEAATLGEEDRSACPLDGVERPDVLLMESYNRLDENEAEMLRAVRRNQLAAKIIVLGSSKSLASLWQTHRAEIDGYVLRTTPNDLLIEALNIIISGHQILPVRPAVAPQQAVAEDSPNGLSAREMQILRQLVGGSSNKAIARSLAISHETVRVHMKVLFRKLKTNNRTQAALWALERGFGGPVGRRSNVLQADEAG